ncbi:MAG: hypothetical protein GC136_08305 [Alphaproteobacteria bacterium]|nr:hypothetical protein [Alphaproteobacteria bacterium]
MSVTIADRYTGPAIPTPLPLVGVRFAAAEIPDLSKPLGNFNLQDARAASDAAVRAAQSALYRLDNIRAPESSMPVRRMDPRDRMPFQTMNREMAGGLFGFTAGIAITAINPVAGFALETVNVLKDIRNFILPARQVVPTAPKPSRNNTRMSLAHQRKIFSSQLNHHLMALAILHEAARRQDFSLKYAAPAPQPT